MKKKNYFLTKIHVLFEGLVVFSRARLQAVFFLAVFSAVMVSPANLRAEDLLEITNKSDLKILKISSNVERFKNEKRNDDKNVNSEYEIYKSGYKLLLRNTGKRETAVKLELLLNYLGSGTTYAYVVYDTIGAKKSKTISVMCDNIPVDCLIKRGKTKLNPNCKDQVLALWEKHPKTLVINTLK